MRPKPLHVVIAVAACVALAFAAVATAGGRAETTVTIKVDGGDYHGKVKSPEQSCITDRNVKLFKVKGGAVGGGDDKLVGSDTADENGEWNIQNTGSKGKHYARAKKTEGCKADNSPVKRTEN